ncbi:MAG: hypothetical protein IIV61_05135 [Oscillospiraceae bacterium]|nr:hypothetical protein [Oscillospiraceae bacterium]
MKKMIRSMTLLIGIAIIILDSNTASEGIRQGIHICLQTVIPSLFPFIVLCAMMTGDLATQSTRIFSGIASICHIPSGSAPLLITGLIGGYPTGAKSIDQAYSTGRISKNQAERLLPLCNQCGPAFLFGMVRTAFDDPRICWALWAVQLVSVSCTAQLLPSCDHSPPQLQSSTNITLTTALRSGVRTMADICGWVILFRMLICFLERWILWSIPPLWHTAIIGALEISNGCLDLRSVESVALRSILCAGMLSFGGLCVTMQTLSVISPSLEKRRYLYGKLVQCIISVTLCASVILIKTRPWLSPIPISIVLALILMKLVVKRSRFSRRIHV